MKEQQDCHYARYGRRGRQGQVVELQGFKTYFPFTFLSTLLLLKAHLRAVVLNSAPKATGFPSRLSRHSLTGLVSGRGGQEARYR
jgi:hypothetical protein